MKTLRCSGCNVVVAKVEVGSKLKKGSVMLCSDCESSRKLAISAKSLKESCDTNKKSPYGDMFDGLGMGGLFR